MHAEDQNLPEYALPHLVYMLAHHEDFEASCDALDMFSQYAEWLGRRLRLAVLHTASAPAHAGL